MDAWSNRHSPFPRRALRLLRLSVLLAAGPAGASSCEAPEEMLDLRIGQTSRGSHIVHVRHDGPTITDLLIPADALRPTEQSYVAERVDCGGRLLIRLIPELRVTYDEENLAVRIAPLLSRVSVRDIDVQRALTPPPAPVSPAAGADFGVRSQLSYDLRRTDPPTPTQLEALQAYVGTGGGQGRLTGYVGVLYTRTPNRPPEWQVRATALYELSDTWTIYAGYHAEPGVTQPGFNPSTSSGVSATYRRLQPNLAAPLTIQLENPSLLGFIVNGQLIGTLEAPAGEVTLRRLPLPPGVTSTLTLLIEDENGVSQRSFPNLTPAGEDPRGLQQASVTATHDDRPGWSGAATASFGLTPTLSVDVQGTVSPGGAGSVSGHLRGQSGAWTGTLGAQVTRTPPAPGTPAQISTLLDGAAGYRRPNLNVTASARLPTAALSGTRLSLRATYTPAPWNVTVGASSTLNRDTWQVDGSVSRTFNDRASGTFSFQVQPLGWQAALRATYVFTPNLQGAAAVTAQGRTVTPAAALTYRPDETQTISIAADREDVTAAYAISRAVNADVTASTRGASAQVTGGVTYLQGRLSWARGLTQRGVLVRTGVPGMPLTVNGVGGLKTDATGDALITTVPAGKTVTIRFELAQLPLGVSATETQIDTLPASTGVTILDLRSNFQVATFVQFTWIAGQPAASADLYLDGERYPLDREGYGLIPRATVSRSGELRAADGRRCPVTIPPGADQVSCAAPTQR